MPAVDYQGKPLSDHKLRATLLSIATTLANPVRVTSGDRTNVPAGGAQGSLHLSNHAVDFHVTDMTDTEVFAALRTNRVKIFGPERGNEFRFQIIQHGKFTKTQGPHIHMGYAPPGFAGLRGFLVEGLQAGQHSYVTVDAP